MSQICRFIARDREMECHLYPNNTEGELGCYPEGIVYFGMFTVYRLFRINSRRTAFVDELPYKHLFIYPSPSYAIG